MSGSSINLSPHRPHIRAERLPDLIEPYIDEARLRVASTTADSYDYALSLLLEWWGEAGPALGYVLDERAWQLYEQWLRRRPSAQSKEPLTFETRRKLLGVCRQLLAWAHRCGYLDRDFSSQVPPPRNPAPKRGAPDVDDLRRLMIAAGESRKPVRDQALVAVFVGTGIRRAEAAALDVDDVSFHADGSGLLRLRVTKLGKPRTVAFDELCGDYLSKHLDEAGRTTGPLFGGWHGSRLTPKSVYSIVKSAMQRAGVDSRGAGPHDLRRAFATAWLRTRRSLGDGQLLSMQLGHSTEAMSVHYSRPTLDDLQTGFVSPLGLL